MTDEELAAVYWAPTDPPWAWAGREGYPHKLAESSMWNEIAGAAQYNGWGRHRKMGPMNAPAMEIGEPARPEVVAAYKVLARQFGYEIVEVKDEREWFEFRVSPAIWPPSRIGRMEQLSLFEGAAS